MKSILKSILLLAVVGGFASAQQAWVNGGNFNSVPAFVTGGYTLTLSDTARCDTTNGTNVLYSAVLQNSVGNINEKRAMMGWVILDTAKQGTIDIAPTGTLALQGSLNGVTFITVVDSIISTRFYTPSVRTGGIRIGAVNLSTLKYPYWRLAITPSATLGTISNSAWVRAGKFKFVIIPVIR